MPSPVSVTPHECAPPADIDCRERLIMSQHCHMKEEKEEEHHTSQRSNPPPLPTWNAYKHHTIKSAQNERRPNTTNSKHPERESERANGQNTMASRDYHSPSRRNSTGLNQHPSPLSLTYTRSMLSIIPPSLLDPTQYRTTPLQR